MIIKQFLLITLLSGTSLLDAIKIRNIKSVYQGTLITSNLNDEEFFSGPVLRYRVAEAFGFPIDIENGLRASTSDGHVRTYLELDGLLPEEINGQRSINLFIEPISDDRHPLADKKEKLFRTWKRLLEQKIIDMRLDLMKKIDDFFKDLDNYDYDTQAAMLNAKIAELSSLA